MNPNQIESKKAFHTVPVLFQWWLTSELYELNTRPLSTLRIKHSESKFYFDVRFGSVDNFGVVHLFVSYHNPELKITTHPERITVNELICLLRHSHNGSLAHTCNMGYDYESYVNSNFLDFVKSIVVKHKSMSRLTMYTCDVVEDLNDVLNFLALVEHDTKEFVYVFAAVKAMDPLYVASLRLVPEEDLATFELATLQLVDGRLNAEAIALVAASAISMYRSGFDYKQIFAYKGTEYAH